MNDISSTLATEIFRNVIVDYILIGLVWFPVLCMRVQQVNCMSGKTLTEKIKIC